MKKLLYILLFIPLALFGQSFLSIEQDIPLELQEGWNLFGFTCLESINVINAFSVIEESIIIAKDNDGNAYLPEWDFNGIGDLEYSRGYQIKLTQEISDFQFCPAIVPLVDSDGDGVYDIEEIEGCMDISACNYNELATDVGICEFPIEGYDCEGNIVPQYQVGDYAEGGIIFYVDESGQQGLVAAMEDLEGTYQWGCYGTNIAGADGTSIGTGYQNTLDIVAGCSETPIAASEALAYESEGYDDWYLPSQGELFGMYITIGNGGPEGNIGGFEYYYYWSSSEDGSYSAWNVDFSDGGPLYYDKVFTSRVRVIRAFGYNWIEGCLDEVACNYNPEIIDFNLLNCEYPETNYNCDGNLLEACPYDIYFEYGADALNYNANLCQTLIVYGCTDYIAENYYSQANTDDNSCAYIFGCMDTSADNYNSEATQDDSTCIYLGCMDEIADNYNPQANQEDGSCIYLGCMNPTADNYDVQVNQDDGSCIIYGCTLADFPNYNSEATIDDFSCDMSSDDVFGCTNLNYLEYEPSVNQDNGTCSVLVVYGCTGPDHCNYNPEANTDDGSCIYPQEGYDCNGNITAEIGDIIQGGMLFYIDETGQHGLVASLENLESGLSGYNGGSFNGYEWGCYGPGVNGADGQSIGTGYQNTMDIVNQGCTPEYGYITAAQAALDAEINGYSDWYLPSFDELVEMYITIGNEGPEGDIGGFDNNLYWSSSENDIYSAWYVSFYNGNINWLQKDILAQVRVIRAF